MKFIQLSSGKMLNLNFVSFIDIQYDSVVYTVSCGDASQEVYEQFPTPEDAVARYDEIANMLLN